MEPETLVSTLIPKLEDAVRRLTIAADYFMTIFKRRREIDGIPDLSTVAVGFILLGFGHFALVHVDRSNGE